MKCELCGGTIALVSDTTCEFCIADIQYVELSYSEVS